MLPPVDPPGPPPVVPPVDPPEPLVPPLVPPVLLPLVPPPEPEPVPPPLPPVPPPGGDDPGVGEVVGEFGVAPEFIFDEPPPQLTSSMIDGNSRPTKTSKNFNSHALNTRVRRGVMRHSKTRQGEQL